MGLAAEAHELDERSEAAAVLAGDARRHFRRAVRGDQVWAGRAPAEDDDVPRSGRLASSWSNKVLKSFSL